MLEPPQLLLPILLAACLVVIAGLIAALVAARRGSVELRRAAAEHEAQRRKLAQLEGQGDLAGWITQDFLRFMREIHGPIPVRRIPTLLAEFIVRTFDPAGTVVLLRRKPAVSDPDREHQLVVATTVGTHVRQGSLIELGEGDLGYVAQKRRVMDRRELDQTPSAGGDAGALAGFHAELAAPMAVGGRTLGAVGIGRPGKPVPRAKELLDLVAHTAALALENTLVLHKISTAASADPLTGVYNKGALAHRLGELIEAARQDRREVAVFRFDVDHFGSYNDANGRLAGDELLRLLASLVSEEVRTDDVFGRLGGEEFLLILPGRSAKEAEMTGGKLLRLVRELRFPGAGSQPLGKITISGGVAVFPHHAEESAGLLRAADRALYRAKERGRDRVVVGHHPVAEQAPAAAEIEPEAGDDLRRINGIGPSFEQILNEIGITTYRQIAELNWTRMVLVASRLNSFPERIVRDRWLQQARQLHQQKYGEEL